MKMQINITKEVLKRSKECNDKFGENCAIAVAISDLFGKNIWVDTCDIIFFDKDRDCIGISALSSNARDFIVKFDHLSSEDRLMMDLISFEVDIPDEVIEMCGGVEEVYKILEESKTMQLVNV